MPTLTTGPDGPVIFLRRLFMKKSQKKLLILLLTLILSFSFGCTKNQKAKIPEDIFTYHLNMIMDENPGISEEEAIKKAEKISIVYYKVNRKFMESKLQLTNKDKKDIADKTNNYWDMFYKFYDEIGVDKTTLTNAHKAAVYRKILISKDQEKSGALTDDVLKKYFNDNFICFKSVSFPIVKVDESGKKVKLNDDEIKKLEANLNKMKESVKDDKTFEAVVAENNKITGESETEQIELKIINKEDKRYSKEAIEKIFKTSVDNVEIIKDEEAYYLIQKVGNDGQFENNKEFIIDSKTKQDAEKITSSWYKDEKFSFNKQKEKNIYNKIKSHKQKRENA